MSRLHTPLALLVCAGTAGLVPLIGSQIVTAETPDAVRIAKRADNDHLPPAPSLPTAPFDVDALDGDSSDETADASAAARKEVELLQASIAALVDVPSYTCRFTKQERINGTLGSAQKTTFKMRHEPFSVYMKWHNVDKGRELIYVQGECNGKMLVHAGGWRARFLPVLTLNPKGSIALSESRHPITQAGMLELARTALEYRQRDLKCGGISRTQHVADAQFNDCPCDQFITHYNSQDVSPVYRKTVLFIDKELSLPVCVENYTWSTDADPATIDEETLIESYRYTDIVLDANLSKADFARGNKAYAFKN